MSKTYYDTLCKVCGFEGTKCSNGDVEYCNECYAVEQGFIYLELWNDSLDLYVDEDGNLYNDYNELIGSEI